MMKTPSPLQSRLAKRARLLLEHPQGMGNYFTFKNAIDILGLDRESVAPDGVYGATGPGYFDMGYMANHIGPPQSATEAFREAARPEILATYPPDCMRELKEVAAAKKFGRCLGRDFDILGVEGAQGGIGYTYLSLLEDGDEVIVTDPGYFHFVPAAELCGAKTVAIELNEANGYRLNPEEVRKAITPRTKLIVVCDPINPFGTVQTRDELLEIAELARENGIFILNNITHATHQTNPDAVHIPMASLHDIANMDHVVSVTGVSKGYGMPALRVGFMGGHPSLLRGAFLAKMEVTKIHINFPGQYAAWAALRDQEYVDRSTLTIRDNFRRLRDIVATIPGVRIPVEPDYGFCTMLDVAQTGVTAQEITVGLLKHRIAAIPGDGLGESKAADYLRLNYSHPDAACFEQFRTALASAIKEARFGLYAAPVHSFFQRFDTSRAQHIIRRITPRL